MSKQARRQAFTVAGTQQLKVVQTVFDELQKAIDKGTPLEEWKRSIKKKIKGDFADKNSHTLTTAFINANQTAYNTGRWYQMTDPAVTGSLKYWAYDSVLDTRTTEVCLALNGTIRQFDDPWWLTHFPPMHHRCRSSVRALSPSMAKRRGGITKELPRPNIADDFGLAPPLRVGQVWEPDLKKVDPSAAREYVRKQGRMKAANDNADKRAADEAKRKASEDAAKAEQERIDREKRLKPVAPAWMEQKSLDVVAEKRPASMGVNAAKQLTIQDGEATQKAIWKVADSAATGDAKGEVAMWRLDRAIGGETVVPDTVARKFAGEAGSLQAFVDGATSTFRLELTAAEEAGLADIPKVRRMFLLDVLGANEDHHEENTLWTRVGGQLVPHAIDNGLSFTKVSPSGFRFARERLEFKLAVTTLDEASIATLRGIQLSEVAETLHAGGLEPRRIEGALGRIKSLQENPQQLSRHADRENPEATVKEWISRTAAERAKAGEYSKADLLEIRRLSKKP